VDTILQGRRQLFKMGSPDAYRPRVSLPRLGEGPARPVPGRLLWPDGQRSTGQVVQAQDGRLMFVASHERDGVLAQRGDNKPARPRERAPAPLPVSAAPGDPSGRKFVPRLPPVLADDDFEADGQLRVGQDCYWQQVEPGDLELRYSYVGSMEPQQLAEIVIDVGAAPGAPGLTPMQEVAMKHVFARSLQAVASQCTRPEAALNAAQALQSGDSAVFLGPQDADSGNVSAFDVRASFDAEDIQARLTALSPGQIWHIRAVQKSDTSDFHSMSIAVQRQDDGNLRLSVTNSNGWFLEERDPDGDIPGVFKIVTPDQASATLQDLAAGRLPPRPRGVSERSWSSPAKGKPLLAWWLSARSVNGEISADFHGGGKALRSARQKAEDCSSENLFAFLATVLPPADYKLAKAACLNTLVQIADRLEPPGTADANSPLQAARKRLQQRITTSLSGHMVAPRAGAGEGGGPFV
jgi:hypothetical protein